MSILDHPDWAYLQPWIEIQIYARDGGHKHPRVRIEVQSCTPSAIVRKALSLTMQCVACGAPIHPFRARGNPKRGERVAQNVYFAAACPLNVNVACSRGAEARDEYLAVKAACKGIDHATVPATRLHLR